MSGKVTRRSFLRTSAVGVSAVTLTSGSARAFAANEKVNLGWIGYGGRAQGLMGKILEHCPDAKLRAICDLIPERIAAGQKAAERDKPTGYKDLNEMMDKEKLDGVLVVTQPNVHADTVVPVLQRSIHCFAEKPMDISVEKIDLITAAARKSKGIYQIGTQRRYHPVYLKAMDALHNNNLAGKITFMQGGWHWSQDPSGASVARDGGRLIEQASHHMDVMSWVMKNDHPISCVAMALQDNPPKDPNQFSETKSATIFQFAEGALFSYTHLWLLPGKYDDEILRAYGEKGAMDFNDASYMARDEKQQRFGERIGKAWDQGTNEELMDFVDNIKTGAKRKPNANVDTGRICSLMCIMGRMAMVNKEKNAYEPSVIRWKDLHTSTDL